MEQIKVNVLGDTQREQWHSVVNVVRAYSGCMGKDGINGICAELDRYIDFAEDKFDEIRNEAQDDPINQLWKALQGIGQLEQTSKNIELYNAVAIALSYYLEDTPRELVFDEHEGQPLIIKRGTRKPWQE